MTPTLQQRAIALPTCSLCGKRLDHDNYIRQCAECAVKFDAVFAGGQQIDARRDMIAGEYEFREAKREGLG
jgi:predicted amidophosphoribosyltransferase